MVRFRRVVSTAVAVAVGCVVLVTVPARGQSDGAVGGVQPIGGPVEPVTPEEAESERWKGKPFDPNNGFGPKESPIVAEPPKPACCC